MFCGVRTLENYNPYTSFFRFYKFSHCCRHETSLKTFNRFSSQSPSCQQRSVYSERISRVFSTIENMSCDFPGCDKYFCFGRSFFSLP